METALHTTNNKECQSNTCQWWRPLELKWGEEKSARLSSEAKPPPLHTLNEVTVNKLCFRWRDRRVHCELAGFECGDH